MIIRPTSTTDCLLGNAWRALHKVPQVPLEALPPTGCVAWLGEEPLAMAWLYFSNSKLAYLAWPVAKPGLAARKSRSALEACFRQLIALAREAGASFIVTTASHRGLTRLLASLGMKQGTEHTILTMEVG